MMTEQERENMIQFLVTYFEAPLIQLMNMSDSTLESTYEFAYYRKEMECDF